MSLLVVVVVGGWGQGVWFMWPPMKWYFLLILRIFCYISSLMHKLKQWGLIYHIGKSMIAVNVMVLLILLGLVAVSVTVLLMVCVMKVLVSVTVIQSGEENTVKFLPVLIIVIIMETVLIRNVIVRKDTLVSLYLCL